MPAKKILAAANRPAIVGYSGQFKQYEGLICNMMEYILGNGGKLWDEVRHGQRSGTAGGACEAVRFVRDRIIGEISHRGVLAYEEPESLALFTEGRAIFHRNWPYAWAVANDSEEIEDRRTGSAWRRYRDSRRPGRRRARRLADRRQPLFDPAGPGLALRRVYDRREYAEAHRSGDRSGAYPHARFMMIRKLAKDAANEIAA